MCPAVDGNILEKIICVHTIYIYIYRYGSIYLALCFLFPVFSGQAAFLHEGILFWDPRSSTEESLWISRWPNPNWILGRRSSASIAEAIRVVVSFFFNVHSYLGKIPILTDIFQMG